MSSLNKVMLIGRLGRDPEIRFTQGGDAVCNFTMATDEKWNDKASGQKHERTEWHRIVVWNKLAELCAEYLKKGRQVYVEGKLQTREWQDKEGQKRTTTEVMAFQVVFLSDGSNQQPRQEQAPSQPQRSGPGTDDYNGREDVPF